MEAVLVLGSYGSLDPDLVEKYGCQRSILVNAGSVFTLSKSLLKEGCTAQNTEGTGLEERFAGLIRQIAKETTEHEVQHHLDETDGIPEEEIEPRAKAINNGLLRPIIL